MKKSITLFLISIASLQLHPQDKSVKTSPRIMILATGGTIAGSGESSTKAAYKAGKVPIDDLLNAVPAIHQFGKITGEQVASIGSQDMNIATWLVLSNRINQIFEQNLADAIVVTHGTDTMESTAYFLKLTVMSNKPVVVVGSMRPSTALSQDGNRNLLDAVMVAADSKTQGKGVVVAMNEKVFDPRDVTKGSSTNIETFVSRNFGPIGLIYDSKVSYYYQSLKNPSKKFDVTKLTSLPQVEIVYGYADASPITVSSLINSPAKGIIYDGMGNGNFNEPVGKELALAAKKGMLVVRSNRTGSGRTTLENEVDDKALGFIVADDLSAQKARILLMLSLTETTDRDKIQQNFFDY
nr:type II asparaginase [uncultured Flavobacterium sp.]